MNVLMALLHLYGRLVLGRSRGEQVRPARPTRLVLVPVPITMEPTRPPRIPSAA
jgi:hypothetical protein